MPKSKQLPSAARPLANHLTLEKQKLAKRLGVSEDKLDQIAKGFDEGWERDASTVLQNFNWQSVGAGRPVGPKPDTEAQACKEFELRKSGQTYAQIRDTLYPKKIVEIDAIKQRVRRYAQRHGLRLK
jgi:hypothetical protein